MSLRKAIDAKCKECIYDDSPGSGGTWRQQVEAFTSYSCPLYPVRPISEGGTREKPGDSFLARENGQNGGVNG